VILERLGDISAVCSHCGLMIQDHVTYMLVVVELWTEFRRCYYLIKFV
jgi:hypothetical protein